MGKLRTQPKRGMSYFDANAHRLITVDDDVLGVKSQIESLWPELSVFFDAEAEEWVIVEMCKDNTERLCFTTPALCDGTLDRIRKAMDNYSYVDEIDAHNDQLEKEADRRFTEQINEANERLHFALRRDGLTHYPKIVMSDSIGNRTSRYSR